MRDYGLQELVPKMLRTVPVKLVRIDDNSDEKPEPTWFNEATRHTEQDSHRCGLLRGVMAVVTQRTIGTHRKPSSPFNPAIFVFIYEIRLTNVPFISIVVITETDSKETGFY